MATDELYENRYEVNENGCWLWTGTINTEGYGVLGSRPQHKAHRWMYEKLVGPIPDLPEDFRLHIKRRTSPLDHTCHNGTDCRGGSQCLHRRCVNPEHLEPVCYAVNVKRSHVRRESEKTHCAYGHEYTADNTYMTTKGTRRCLECRRITDRRRQDSPGRREQMRRANARSYSRRILEA
jgi:hypothetical protein